jgi:hypothetical protein
LLALRARKVEEAMDFRTSLSLLALTACLAHGGWLLICKLTGRRQGTASSLPIALLLSCLLLVLTAAQWQASDTFPVPALGQLLVLVAVAGWLLTHFVRLSWKSVSIGGRWRAIGSGLADVLLIAAAAWNFQAAMHCEPAGLEFDQAQVQAAIDDPVLVTDEGRIFSVFHYGADESAYVDRALEMYPDKVVQVAAPDMGTNCHGWVFAGGRCGLSETAVAALLEDNGYSPVQSPLPGDVIVYRDEAGEIVHSGRVQSVKADQVLVESKWGAGGRYLHGPEDQCYSPSFAYYRSSRPTHEARIVQRSVASGRSGPTDRYARSANWADTDG